MHDSALDGFSQEMPWEDERLSDEKDWNGEQLVVGVTYKRNADTGEVVHEDEMQEYIREMFDDYVPEI